MLYLFMSNKKKIKNVHSNPLEQIGRSLIETFVHGQTLRAGAARSWIDLSQTSETVFVDLSLAEVVVNALANLTCAVREHINANECRLF